MSDLRSLAGFARSLVIYRARPWRIPALARFYAAMIGPGDLAFDIGAHAGNRTRAMLRTGARVVAVEPQAAFHAFLARDLPAGATLVRAAAGSAPGEARLAVSRLHPTLASLAPGYPRRMARATGFEHVRWDAAETVAVTTLDALIAEHGLPRLIKIDVEGYEAEVLRGLSQPVRWIAFEYLPATPEVAAACLDRLAALGSYRYNLVPGEAGAFALPGWTDAAGLAAVLAARASDGRSGDVYARMDPRMAGDAPRPLALALAAGVIALALMQPNHPASATWGALRAFPLELPALLIALVLGRGPAAWGLRVSVTGLLALMTALKAADFASNLAFERPYNPIFDLHLAAAGWRLLSGAIGVPAALAALVLLVSALALAVRVLWWATGRFAALDSAAALRGPLRVALGVSVAVVAADVAREASPVDPPGVAFTTRVGWEHVRDAVAARADLAAFRRAAAADPLAALAPEATLPALRGTDILLVFVESYGRTSLESSRFAAATTATLAKIEVRLAAAGLAMRSGYLASPTLGGQSWLAHATLLSGLPIDNQGRYRALVASPRRTLLGLAQAAGWRSVAVAPAITLPWPEAEWFGYDRVLAAADLGYAGKPFNWVTMPDQFTLAAFERAELDRAPRPPVIAEIALISSHAPWTPIPELLPWEALGDGRVFDAMAQAGPTPEAVWSDLERVRDQFVLAIDYSLRIVGSFAERRAGSGAPLMVVLGDHQPATFVTREDTGRDVPIHVIGPPEAVARLDGWGWTPGLIPGPDAPVWGMEAFRDRFIAAFGPGIEAVCHRAGPLPKARAC